MDMLDQTTDHLLTTWFHEFPIPNFRVLLLYLIQTSLALFVCLFLSRIIWLVENFVKIRNLFDEHLNEIQQQQPNLQ